MPIDPQDLEKLEKALKKGTRRLPFWRFGHLQGGKKSSQAIRAAQYLGQSGDPAAIPALIRTLHSRRPEVRKAATEALDALGWQADEGPDGAFYALAKGDYGRLAAMGDAGEKALRSGIKDIAIADRLAAARTLAEMGRPQVRPLHTILHQPLGLEQVSIEAAEALGTIPTRRAAHSLIKALGKRRRGIRLAAARGLVALYQSGQLSERDKRLILGQRERISAPHTDRKPRKHTDGQTRVQNHHDGRGYNCQGRPEHKDYSTSGGLAHIDQGGGRHVDNKGIGVDFPL